MVEPRPVKIPLWNTGGSNRTEPTAGEKVTGWSLNDQPPSSYFNWLQYYAGAAIEWLYERMDDGTAEHDVVLQALQPDASGAGGDIRIGSGGPNASGNAGKIELRAASGGAIGDGGAIELNAGASFNNVGGAVSINGGDSTNDAGGDITITAGAGGSGVEGGDLTLKAGDSTNFNGGDILIEGGDATGTNQNCGNVGIRTGESTGSGGGIIFMDLAETSTPGSGVNAQTEYMRHDARSGFKYTRFLRHLILDATADLARGALQLVAKVQPTAPPTGDVYHDSTTDQAAFYNGTRYHNINTTVYSNADPAHKGIANTTTANRYYGFEAATYAGTLQNIPLRYTIPADSLRVGSIIRVRATLEFISGTGDPPDPCVLLGNVLTGTGPYLVGTRPLTAPDVACFEQQSTSLALGVYTIESDIRVRAIGASGRLDYGGWGFNSLGGAARAGVVETLGDTSNYPTNGNLDVYPAIYTNASTDTVCECLKFIVDVI